MIVKLRKRRRVMLSKKTAALIFTVLYVLMGAESTVIACSWIPQTKESRFSNADKVVLVKVVGIENAKYIGYQLYGTSVVEVIKQYKGPDLKRRKFPYNFGIANCAINLQYGRAYLLYLDKDNDTLGMPSGSTEISLDSLPLEDLEGLSREKK